MKPGTQNIMIICLAASDLLVCFVGMPTEIADMRFDYNFESEFACKLLRFVNTICSLWSSFTLVVIAVDRYIKVCRPFGRQMTLRETKTIVLISFLAAIFFSWPKICIKGIRSKDTGIPELNGKECSTSDVMKGTNYPLIYNSVLFVCFVLLTIVFIVLYAKIYRRVKRQKQTMDKGQKSEAITGKKSSNQQRVYTTANSTELGKQKQISQRISLQTDDSLKKPSASSVNLGKDKRFVIENPADSRSTDISGNKTLTEMEGSETADFQKKKTANPQKPNHLIEAGINLSKLKVDNCCTNMCVKRNAREESRTTVIAFLVTIVFVVSYLPYLAMTFYRIFDKEFDQHLRGSSLVAYNLFVRSYFVNSAVNPIIYGFLNLQFSRAVKAMFKHSTSRAG
ncbi:hypothetical protein SNE40_021631 [Patella caerulea]